VGTSSIARDISDRRKSEQLKDDFLALVSHELRTPLSSIVAHVELLLDDDVPERSRRQFMEVIDRNSGRLERLVGDLLFVAQLESANLSLSMTDVDIVAVARDAVDAAAPRARQSGVEVTLVAPEATSILAGDPGRLGQALDNLIANAIKYSPNGGGVTVRILPGPNECLIEVEDQGMGIAAAEQEHLFERFFRSSTAVSRHIQGVGLGLLIVKTIIDGHGGAVSVISEPGSGATFRVALPLRRTDQHPRTTPGATIDAQQVS
jgi:signal transduction histidine kinase